MEKGNTTINSTLVVGLIALVIGIGVGYGLSYGGSDSLQSGKHMMPDGTVMHDVNMGGDMDRKFIEEMIPHHEGAIAMAKIALERSKRTEMLELARGIIKAQEKEIADMRGWYAAWYKTDVPPTMQGMHMGGMTGEPDVLRTVPQTDFDREFIEQMIPHHEMAVMMAQMLSSATQRGEMKQLTKNVVSSQSSEIEMMRGWLKSWYGR